MVVAKYVQVAELLKRRICRGDYDFNTLPGAPRLAEENGIGYLTARRAIQHLIDEGVVRRGSNGRLEILESSAPARGTLNAVHIRPAYFDSFPIWDVTMMRVAGSLSCGLHTVFYRHPDDPVIFEAMDGSFDLVFIQHLRSDELFVNKLRRRCERVVSMFQDLTEHGIRCLDGAPPSAINGLLDRLYALGHRHIDFLNTEPASVVIAQRMEAWRQGLERLSCTGDIHNHPVMPFESAPMAARLLTRNLLASRTFKATALFCALTTDAHGCLRGCYESGVSVPGDISVCSFGNPEIAALSIPALTIVDRPDPEPVIREIFEYYLGLRGDVKKMMYRPENCGSIFEGESIGQASGDRLTRIER